jgi:hypothetical protein
MFRNKSVSLPPFKFANVQIRTVIFARDFWLNDNFSEIRPLEPGEKLFTRESPHQSFHCSSPPFLGGWTLFMPYFR